MKHGNWLRGVATRTLNGTGGQTKSGDIIERFKTADWKPEMAREVERELRRRAKRKNTKNR